jgi:putative hydrolase of the HAD superfamily
LNKKLTNIKHISFDLWLTLIKSNPTFKKERAIFFLENFNPLQKELVIVENCIRSLDRVCDRLNEISGKKVTVTNMYSKILQKLGNKDIANNSKIINNIKDSVNQLFEKHQPVLLNDNILNTLQYLCKEGYTLNIASNTGFIEGKYLIEMLKKLNLYHFFDFKIFSDEVEVSKPSFQFFHKVHAKIQNDLKLNEVLHIGDNFSADYIGAKKYGFHAMHLIDSNYDFNTINDFIHAECN